MKAYDTHWNRNALVIVSLLPSRTSTQMFQSPEHNQAVNPAEVLTQERHRELTPPVKDVDIDVPAMTGRTHEKLVNAGIRMMNRRFSGVKHA